MRLQNQLEYGLFRGALAVLEVLPPARAEKLLQRLARMANWIPRVRSRVVVQQLQLVYPDLDPAELARLTGCVYDHLARTVAEVFCQDPAVLAAQVRVEPGWEPLEQALAQGRGAIVATGHLGNFELGGRILAERFSLLDVVKPQRNELFDRFLVRMRVAHDIGTVPVQQAARRVLAHLRCGGLVSLLVDQDAGKAGVRGDFLGQPASLWTGAARFSLLTGCPVVPMAILRRSTGDHQLCVGAALHPHAGGTDENEVRAYTLRISRAVENYIRQQPDQWFWVHRRWKGAAEAGSANGQVPKTAGKKSSA